MGFNIMNNYPISLYGQSKFTDKPSIFLFDFRSSFYKLDRHFRSSVRPLFATRYIISALLSVLICFFNYSNAQAQNQPDRSSMIELKVETSKPRQTAGTGLGVTADIKNVSDSKIYLYEKRITMTLPPELEGPFRGIRGWWAFFPSVWKESYERYDNVIALQPGDTYKVFWEKRPVTHGRKEASETQTSILKNVIDTIRSELNFIFFTPGEYKISVLAHYWTDPSFPEDDYRIVSESITLQVAAPQSVILLGAALGGLIAYFILPHARRRFIRTESSAAGGKSFFFKRISKEGIGILGAILLSAMVTILLSRISETQFVIRVTVNDFWGAVAIGFVANYAGTKILDKIIPAPTKTSASQKKPTQKPAKTAKKP